MTGGWLDGLGSDRWMVGWVHGLIRVEQLMMDECAHMSHCDVCVMDL